MGNVISGLETLIEYKFSDFKLLEQALTHPSFHHEQAGGGIGDYQRLEFLGDAILGMVLAETLYLHYPGENEGTLSRLRSQMADQDTLASIARNLGVGPFIRLGRGEEQSSGSDKDSILADILESIIAAVYLDGGFEAARRFVVRLFSEIMAKPDAELKTGDAKSLLQEKLSSSKLPPPHYLLLEESGPPHDREFVFQVFVDEKLLGTGIGRSKKHAQQSAALKALQLLETTLEPDE